MKEPREERNILAPEKTYFLPMAPYTKFLSALVSGYVNELPFQSFNLLLWVEFITGYLNVVLVTREVWFCFVFHCRLAARLSS